MIPVRETANGFEPINGNPTLTSLDGKMRAPLRTIMHESWTDEERAAFGIYLVQETAVPEGKRVTAKRYERQGNKVVEVLVVDDAPRPEQRTPEQKVQALARRFGLTIDELRSVLIQDGKQ